MTMVGKFDGCSKLCFLFNRYLVDLKFISGPLPALYLNQLRPTGLNSNKGQLIMQRGKKGSVQFLKKIKDSTTSGHLEIMLDSIDFRDTMHFPTTTVCPSLGACRPPTTPSPLSFPRSLHLFNRPLSHRASLKESPPSPTSVAIFFKIKNRKCRRYETY